MDRASARIEIDKIAGRNLELAHILGNKLVGKRDRAAHIVALGAGVDFVLWIVGVKFLGKFHIGSLDILDVARTSYHIGERGRLESFQLRGRDLGFHREAAHSARKAGRTRIWQRQNVNTGGI